MLRTYINRGYIVDADKRPFLIQSQQKLFSFHILHLKAKLTAWHFTKTAFLDMLLVLQSSFDMPCWMLQSAPMHTVCLHCNTCIDKPLHWNWSEIGYIWECPYWGPKKKSMKIFILRKRYLLTQFWPVGESKHMCMFFGTLGTKL